MLVKKMTVKIIENSKINNIRDLGGTETKNGHVLKNNLFIRCAVPMNIGKIEHENLMELDPAAIIDFRGVEEAKKNPPNLTKELAKKRVHLPIEPKVWSTLNQLNDTNSLNDKTFQETLKEAYEKYTTENLEVYKEFLRILFKNVGKPIMFHCTAGKDRTGFAAALIFLILNVKRETIFKDYLLSNINFKPPKNITKEVSLIGAERLVKVDREWLEAGLKKFFSVVEDIDDFAESLIGNHDRLEMYTSQCLERKP